MTSFKSVYVIGAKKIDWMIGLEEPGIEPMIVISGRTALPPEPQTPQRLGKKTTYLLISRQPATVR